MVLMEPGEATASSTLVGSRQSEMAPSAHWTGARSDESLSGVVRCLKALRRAGAARRPEHGAWATAVADELAFELIAWAAERGASLPRIDAMADGSLRIEWREPHDGLVVNVSLGGRCLASRDGQVDEIDVTTRRGAFQQAILAMVETRRQDWWAAAAAQGEAGCSQWVRRGLMFTLDGMQERHEFEALERCLAALLKAPPNADVLFTILTSTRHARQVLGHWRALRRVLQAKLIAEKADVEAELAGLPFA